MCTAPTISEREAAVEQLDWAIRLLVDHGSAISAITLAGAAEVLLGKHVDGQDNARSAIKQSLADRGFGNAADIGKFMNFTRNFMKHGSEDGCVHAGRELESEAIQLIVRAIINCLRLEKSISRESWRFLNWVNIKRPDLLEDAKS